MKKLVLVILLAVLSVGAFGQKRKNSRRREQPILLREDYSSVYDIRNFEKFYVQPDFRLARQAVAPTLKVLNREPSLRAVKDLGDAQFVITYRETKEQSRMQVYYVREKTMVIVWTEERPGTNRQIELAEEFLKVLQRNKELVQPLLPAGAVIPGVGII